VRIPQFVREVIWSFYPPRYKELSEKKFRESLTYMSKVLLFSFLIAGMFMLPSVFTLKSTIESEFDKFTAFTLEGNVSQSAPLAIPSTQPWIVIDKNNNRTLSSELFVIDQETVQYRFLNKGSISQELLKTPSQAIDRVSGFAATMLLMILPGIIFFLYVRMWLKYLLIIVVFATVFSFISELTKFKVKWKPMLNIATHGLTLLIPLEVLAMAISSKFLIPIIPFLGISIFGVSLLILSVFMVLGIIGCHMKGKRKRK